LISRILTAKTLGGGKKIIIIRFRAIIQITAIVLLLSITGALPVAGCRQVSKDTAEIESVELSAGTDALSTQYQAAPEDLSIELYWNTGPLPPRYHYYYLINIGPVLEGKFEFLPGYEEYPPVPEVWTIGFSVNAAKMDELYNYLGKNNFFRDKWEKIEPSIGGPHSYMTITANGQKYDIPPDSELKPEDTKKTDEIADFVRSLVPEDIWTEMEKRQKEFEESYED